MNKIQKDEVIGSLQEKFSQYQNFYLADSSSLTVAQINKLRRVCFQKKVEMTVAKNTLIRKALEKISGEKYSGIWDALHGQTAILFSENPKSPAQIISSFRTETKGEKPVLKAAFIDTDVYLGDNQLEMLAKLRSKADLIGDVIALLQSPAKRVIGALQSGGGTLGGLLKTLELRGE
jgi:large subunit ribosomal protein L10